MKIFYCKNGMEKFLGVKITTGKVLIVKNSKFLVTKKNVAGDF
jgi:hypothetical protein